VKKKAEKEKENIDRAKAGAGLWLWIGFLLPPIAWAAQLQALWLTSQWGCAVDRFGWNHVVAIAALILSAAGTYIAWTLGKAEPGTPEPTLVKEPQTWNFMSILGTVLGVYFTVVIFAQWLPTLTGVPCAK
jgi:hypothetical protein